MPDTTTPAADHDLLRRIHALGRKRHKEHWETVGRRLVSMITFRRTTSTTQMTQPQAEQMLRMIESMENLIAGRPDANAENFGERAQREIDAAREQRYQELKAQSMCTCDHCVQHGANACKQVVSTADLLGKRIHSENKLFR